MYKVGVWLVGGAGVTGLLIAIGFIIESSSSQFLGVPLRQRRSPADYIAATGEFSLHGVATALLETTAHRYIVLLAMIAIAVTVLLYRLIGERRVSGTLTVAGGVAAFLGLILLDVPTLQLRDVLVRDLQFPVALEHRTFVDALTAKLWRLHVCARVSHQMYGDLAAVGVTCPTKGQEDAVEALQEHFLINVLSAFVGIAIALALWRRSTASGGDKLPIKVLAGAMAIVAGLDLVLLPHSYAKTARPTQASEIIVRTSAELGDTSEHGFLLGQGADFLTLFHKSESQIWEIPLENVKLVRVERSDDVLEFHFLKSLARTTQPQRVPQ